MPETAMAMDAEEPFLPYRYVLDGDVESRLGITTLQLFYAARSMEKIDQKKSQVAGHGGRFWT